jgi:undecaprenyl-diphosphatase
MAVLLMTFTLAYGAKRRSLTPVAFVGAVGALTVALTVGSKMIVSRLDPHGATGANGGSFPSGYVVGVVVCLGIVITVLQPRTGQWIWLIPAVGGVLMGACLLLQAAHWFTDILGATLLATAVLAAASAFMDWVSNRSRNDHESAVREQRNGSSLTRVGESPTWIARLSNAVPDIGLADCYHPGREKFVLRSCGGL